MKLLHCLKCKDMVAMTQLPRKCSCGKSRAMYTDSRNAVYSGPSVVLGMVNSEVLVIGPKYGLGKWFVIPSDASTLQKVEKIAMNGAIIR